MVKKSTFVAAALAARAAFGRGHLGLQRVKNVSRSLLPSRSASAHRPERRLRHLLCAGPEHSRARPRPSSSVKAQRVTVISPRLNGAPVAPARPRTMTLPISGARSHVKAGREMRHPASAATRPSGALASRPIHALRGAFSRRSVSFISTTFSISIQLYISYHICVHRTTEEICEICVNSSGKTPVWKAIADALRGDMAEGRYAPATSCRPRRRWRSASALTATRCATALSALVEEGLIRTRRGAGAFVAATPTDYPIGKRVRFHENLIAAGRRPEKRVLAVGTSALRRQAKRRRWHIAAGEPVCAYHGLSLADGQPIAVFESRVSAGRVCPASRTPGAVEQRHGGAGICGCGRLHPRLDPAHGGPRPLRPRRCTCRQPKAIRFCAVGVSTSTRPACRSSIGRTLVRGRPGDPYAGGIGSGYA